MDLRVDGAVPARTGTGSPSLRRPAEPERVRRVDLSMPPQVNLLDGFTLRPAGLHPGAAEDLPRGVQRLVAHVCLSGRPARAAIAGHLWPDVPEEHAHGSLRSALWRLHKVAPGLIDASGSGLSLATGVRVDVRELGDWAARVLDPRTALEGATLPATRLLGDLLPGWYDDWVLLERERLRQLRLHSLEALAVRLAAAGRLAEALQAAYGAVRAEPLRESAHRTLVAVYLSEGNAIEAIRAYESFRCLLASELGVVPTGQMEELFRRACAP
jgi:DNA-binding SARP family transcriptional activator